MRDHFLQIPQHQSATKIGFGTSAGTNSLFQVNGKHRHPVSGGAGIIKMKASAALGNQVVDTSPLWVCVTGREISVDISV